MEPDATGTPGVDGVTSLYRRFRPGTFAEVRGQDHVVRALRSAVTTDRVAHAYLFSGPRGTGKTSSARILAKALNCEHPSDGEPCGTCRSCLDITRGTSLDVTELDAASTNGVDAIRELVNHAALGTPGRWKVYIVDEVHMLSTAAANALLKTVEEPPPHVVFVLATTDPQKVPATLRSRTQHLEFRLFSGETLHGLLSDIRDAAGLEVDDDALEAAVRRGHGSARDALSALDQVVASGEADDVRPSFDALFEAVAGERATDVLTSLAVLQAAGWSAPQLAAEACAELRQAFLLQLAPDVADAAGADRARLVALGEALGLARTVRSLETLGRAMVEMRDAPDPTVVLEIALVRLARPELDPSPAALLERLERVERSGPAPAPAPPTPSRDRPALGSLRPGARRAAPGAGAPGAASTGAASPGVPPPGAGEPAGTLADGVTADPPATQAPATPPTAATPDAVSPATLPPAADATEAGARGAGPSGARPRASRARDEAPGARSDADAPAGAAPATGEGPDRDALTLAWADAVLPTLSPRARALFSTGRFTGSDGRSCTFAVESEAQREHCERKREEVEAALASHFAAPLRVRLVVDPERGRASRARAATSDGLGDAALDESPAPAGSVATADLATADLATVDLSTIDLDEMEGGEAVDTESIAAARVLDAFPGATEVRP